VLLSILEADVFGSRFKLVLEEILDVAVVISEIFGLASNRLDFAAELFVGLRNDRLRTESPLIVYTLVPDELGSKSVSTSSVLRVWRSRLSAFLENAVELFWVNECSPSVSDSEFPAVDLDTTNVEDRLIPTTFFGIGIRLGSNSCLDRIRGSGPAGICAVAVGVGESSAGVGVD